MFDDDERSASAGSRGVLVISGGGSTAVATEDLSSRSAMLRHLGDEAERWRTELRRTSTPDDLPAPLWREGEPSAALVGLGFAVDEIASEARVLAAALEQAGEQYGATERFLERLLGTSGSFTAWIVGFLGARMLPAIVGAAVGLTGSIGIPALLALAIARGPRAFSVAGTGRTLDDWVQRNRALFCNPVTSALIRGFVSSVDDLVAGVAGVPWPITAALGDDGLGIVSLDTSAAGLLVISRPLGLLRETPVTMRRVTASGDPHRPGAAAGTPGRTPGLEGVSTDADGRVASTLGTEGIAIAPPAGIRDLVERIPPPRDDLPQVRIERYGPVEDPRWLVYIGGTVDWGVAGVGNPWDLRSNVEAMAGPARPPENEVPGASAEASTSGAGSYRGVVAAMAAAGVAPGDSVVPIGHSQGGILAARLAADGAYRSEAVLTIGAPVEQIELPRGLTALQLAHTDDPVPSLGGIAGAGSATGAAAEAGSERVIVRREYFAGRAVSGEGLVPSHAISAYAETAALADESDDPMLTRFRAVMASCVGDEQGVVTWWLGVRR
ncbi:hypothetical protein [Luethyella okanaganae]|uniref:Alpha/beta hydrolase n=1 Tax=Luethyella okanaganae TaxID=69372 RepID=A0ABW1VHX7_9MICO